MTAQRVEFENGMVGWLAGEEGPALILLHPIGLSASTWRHVQPEFARGCRTLALDLLGFGESAKPLRADYSLQSQAGRVLDVAAGLGWGPVSLVGNSLGGGIALAAAIAEPERVASLALISAAAYPGGMPPLRLLAQSVVLEMPARLTAGLAAPWVMRYCFADWKRCDTTAVRTYSDVLARREAIRAFRLTSQALYGPSLAVMGRQYSSVHCPALILHGDRDPIVPRWASERLSRELRHAELHWLRDVGHFPQEEAPEQLLGRLLPFVQGRDRAAA